MLAAVKTVASIWLTLLPARKNQFLLKSGVASVSVRRTQALADVAPTESTLQVYHAAFADKDEILRLRIQR